MDKLYTIRSSLEKILKAIIVKLENGDELSVSQELIWYDNLTESIYDLQARNTSLFIQLIDPNGVFRYRDPIDLSKIDFSKVKLKEGSKRSKKSYAITVIDAENDLLDTFFSFAIKLWEAGVRNDRFEVSKRALYTLGNLYGIIANGIDKSKQFNYVSYFDYFCKKLNSRLASLLSRESTLKENFSLASYFVTHFHLDHLSSDLLPSEKTEVLSSAIFTSLKLCVDYDQERLIDNFVRSASHRNLLPMWPNEISQLDIFVYEKIRNEEIEKELSKKINNITFNQVRSVFTQKEYAEVSDSLHALQDEIRNSIEPLSPEDISLINRCISVIDEHAFRRYKYKLVQKALNHALIYCIFKGKFHTVNFAFQFHSPIDTDATWGNDDIIFDDLFEILKLISFRWEIQSELVFHWPDHHGSPLYIDIYFIGLLDRWVKNNYHNRMNLLAGGTQRIIEPELMKGKDTLVSWIREIGELKAIAQRRYERKNWPFDESTESQYGKLVEILNMIENEFIQATT